MTSLRSIVALACLALLISTRPASAQLFGQRTLGSPLSPRAMPGAGSSVAAGVGGSVGVGSSPASGGTASGVSSVVRGNERFLRRARSGSAFVGRDLDDRPGFIGSQQGEVQGQVRSAAPATIVTPPSLVNRDLTEAAALARRRPYPARLRVAFDYDRPSAPARSAVVTARISEVLAARWPQPVAVEMVEAGKAIVRGLVPTAHDRVLVEQLVRLEPGVSEVENLLQVSPP